ncbi:MAG TPA: nuclease-related domain-containing protein, partial [Anaerolineae bacterium]|nr:nuclease-related domain-containing protein [Anaerolineae bacterium]
LDSRYVAYHYFYPAEHLLLTPSGLIAIQAQDQQGWVAVRGRHWRHGPLWQRLRVLFGNTPLGNPAANLRRSMAATAQAVAKLGDEVAALPIEGLVVFHSGRVKLTAEDPEFPALLADELKAKVREMAEARPALSSRSHKALAAALAGREIVEEAPEPAEEAQPAKAPRQKRSHKARR